MTHVRRAVVPLRFRLDHLFLHARRGGAPDAEDAVAVVVVVEVHERLLVADEKHGAPWLSRSLVSGSARAIRRTAAEPRSRPGLRSVPVMPSFLSSSSSFSVYS